MLENLGDIIASENLPKTRNKKINQKYKQYDEETKHHLKLSKLSILEEDEELQKEEYFYY